MILQRYSAAAYDRYTDRAHAKSATLGAGDRANKRRLCLRHRLCDDAAEERMIDRICPVCAANTNSPFLVKDSVKLVRCTSCGMIFSSPVAESYINGSFYEDAGRPFYLSPEKLTGDYSPVRFIRELRLFREACPSGKVLDIGCSNGAFLFQLGQQFPGAYQLFGTDVSGPALDYAESKGIKTIRHDFLAADFPGANFDAITLWAVLEHVSEPARFVQQAARLLNPGGICIVLVPRSEEHTSELQSQSNLVCRL